MAGGKREEAVSNTFTKLNLKKQHEILVVNAPESFEMEMSQLPGIVVQREARNLKSIEFCLVFVTTRKELDELAMVIINKAVADAVLWFAYPKRTSKRYQSDLSRDTGWDELGRAGFECVRMVAIDEDWSAARFRHIDFIKTLNRAQKRTIKEAVIEKSIDQS